MTKRYEVTFEITKLNTILGYWFTPDAPYQTKRQYDATDEEHAKRLGQELMFDNHYYEGSILGVEETKKQYTICFSIQEVDEDGDTSGEELDGATMSWKTSDDEIVRNLFSRLVETADAEMEDIHATSDDVTPRRPEDEDEETT